MRKGSLFVFSALLSLFLLPNMVDAKDIEVKNTDKIQDVISADTTLKGDVLVLEEGTYVEDLTLNKDITLKGLNAENTIIEGSVVISADVTLESLTVQGTSSELIDINGKENGTVNILDSIIKYKDYTDNDYGTNYYTSGIRLSKSSNGTTLNVNGTKIYAQYGIWVNGEKNNVTITDSEITGWSALDISNSTTATETAKNNIVSVSTSTLTGVSYNSVSASNAYGTIVIGGQENLRLTITDSTIQNRINTLNEQDLIMFADSYLPSKNVMVLITESTLKNTDTSGNSYVYNWRIEENAKNESANMIITGENVLIESPEGKVNAEVPGYVNLTISTFDGESYMKVQKGTIMTEPVNPEVEGYTFDGWFTDENYTTKFDFTKELTEDTTIVAKFTEIEEVDNEPIPENNSSNNPHTSDINMAMMITFTSLSLAGIMFSLKQKILRSM